MSLTLKVSEIFYSLAGEGARAGEASIFVRLSGCSAKHACYQSGVKCDTEFESSKEMTFDELLGAMNKAEGKQVYQHHAIQTHCYWIVFTGGEPLDQLQVEHLRWFLERGYKIAIETSGIKRIEQDMADCISHICISPKVAEHVLIKNFGHIEKFLEVETESYNIEELRYVRHSGQPGVPVPSLKANYYYLSPHSDGAEINQENLKHCIKLCLENPMWRLSTQQHKWWKVL